MPPVVAARQHRVEAGEVRRAGRLERRAHRRRRARRAGATLSRSGSSKRMKSWNTAVTRARHDVEVELAQVDAVDLDRARLRVVEPAQQLGERRLAGAVLADDRQRRAGGDREVEVRRAPARRRDSAKRHVAEADLARRQAGGRRGRPTRSAPAGAIAGSSRSTAATGAAAPSSAQFSPPNAISDVPTRALREDDDAAPRSRRPVGGGARRATRTRRRWRRATSSRLQQHRLLAQPRRLVLQLVQPRAARDEAVDRPVGEAEQPQLLGRPADRRPAGTRSRRRAARARTSSVLRSRQTALSRSSQCVASQAPREHERRPPRVAERARRRDARPPIISTRPPAMKSIEIDSGGPVMPRSKSRATVRSLVSVGSSRWPMPGGRTHASVSRS